MMWLTKIVPDLRYRQTRADFRTAGNLHRKLIRLSSDLGEERIANPRQQSGLLFRIEETRNELYLLVQSYSPLRVDRLGPGYHGVQMRNLDPFLARLDKGSRVRYRIVASPTKRLGRSENNTQRLGLKEPPKKTKRVHLGSARGRSRGVVAFPCGSQRTGTPQHLRADTR